MTIGGEGSQDYIHEIRVPGLQDDLPVLVMIHGYMRGGMQFYKMMPHLRKKYHVIAVDLLGMGASSRNDYGSFVGFESTIRFFVDSIHRWT